MAIRSLARALAHAALLLATASYSACPAHQELLLRYGYAEVRPPARILMPGSLIVLTNREPLEARVICGAEASLGPHVRYMRSTTADASLKKIENKRFDVDASAVSALREHEHFESVHGVTATLHNATILEVSDAEVVRGLTERSYECAEAVRQRINNGYTVTMVSSALVADMSYQVQWEHNHGHKADLAGKAQVLNDLAVVLEGNVTSTASGEIRAAGLVWGIRDDEYLSALSASSLAPLVINVGKKLPVKEGAILSSEHADAVDPDYAGRLLLLPTKTNLRDELQFVEERYRPASGR